MNGVHQGRPSGPTSVNEQSAASTASIVMIGISAAISAGIRGVSSGAERRSTAILAAAPRLALTRLPRFPSPPARNSRRREIVAPAAATHVRHASQRVTSASTCSAAASSSTHSGAACNASANSSRRSASTSASTTATASAPATVAAALLRPFRVIGGSTP